MVWAINPLSPVVSLDRSKKNIYSDCDCTLFPGLFGWPRNLLCYVVTVMLCYVVLLCSSERIYSSDAIIQNNNIMARTLSSAVLIAVFWKSVVYRLYNVIIAFASFFSSGWCHLVLYFRVTTGNYFFIYHMRQYVLCFFSISNIKYSTLYFPMSVENWTEKGRGGERRENRER
jgi:hypothetical protein